jgi:hypothetical protein
MRRTWALYQAIVCWLAACGLEEAWGAAPPKPVLTRAQADAAAYFRGRNDWRYFRVVRGIGGRPETALIAPHLSLIQDDPRYMQAFLSLPNIVSVQVGPSDVDDLDVHLPLLARLKSLRHLEIERGRLGKPALAALARMRGLDTLLAYGSDLNDKGLDLITKALPGLQRLDIGGCSMTEKGFRHLARLKRLRSVRLMSDAFKSAHLKYLSRDTLEELDLAGCKVDDRAGPLLSKFSRLRSLALCNNRITGAIMPHLARIKGLSSLGLQYADIGDAGLKSLAGHKRLEKLNLMEVKLSPAALSVLPTLSRLRVLVMSNTWWTQRVVRTLVRCRRLEELDTGRTWYRHTGEKDKPGRWCDDHGLRALASLPRLKRIDVRSPPVTDATIKQCLKCYPALDIRAWSGEGCKRRADYLPDK